MQPDLLVMSSRWHDPEGTARSGYWAARSAAAHL